MSDPLKDGTLCERCRLLSFDDGAIGGQEVVGEDGVPRLSFPESKIESRPDEWLEIREHDDDEPDYRLVRLDWELDEILPDMPHLSRSSQLGCVFCQALRKSLEETLAEEAKTYSINDGPLSLAAYLSLVDEGIEGLVIEGIFNQDSLDSVVQIIFPIEASSTCHEWLSAQFARDRSYLNPANIHKMRQLLDHCTSTCHLDSQSSFMPTRLIDIGHDVSALPCLVLSSNIRHPQQTKYAALSYCWGTETDAKSQFKTERTSLENRCAGLPRELMTSTTNDAIVLARAIGLRYLWIDALCIIQDDENDWSHESSQMNLVYRHAFVTLCSLNSDSCHEGFLNRVPAVEIPFQSTIRKAIKGFCLIRLRSRAGTDLDRRRYIWDSILSKWNRRCWTFQEKEMSTRLLLFGSLRMHFACARSEWSEGDETVSERFTSGVTDQIIMFKDNRISSRALYDCWGSLVHQYGHRLVTFGNDRLPAIAGLARMIGEALQDRYLAGLWEGDLQFGLTWHSSGHSLSRGLETHIRSIRERNYVAPSWSWAACPTVGIKGYEGTHAIEESTVIDANTDADSGDPYGQVSGGLLRIRGKMARMPDWLPNDEGTHWSNSWFQYLVDPLDDNIHVFTDWLHEDKEAGVENLVVLLLYRIKNEIEATEPELRALLLHPADELGTYYRVGVVSSDGYEGYREMRGWFKESQEETICII